MSVCCVCVGRFGISLTYMIEGIDSELIFVCLFNDYSLIADLHIFVYACAACLSISLECIKVKLIILRKFWELKPKPEPVEEIYKNDSKEPGFGS